MKNFETQFSAAVAKFNSFSSTTMLPQCITSFLMLLSNESIEHSQHVSALSAAAPTGTAFPVQASNDEFLEVVTYSQLSSIVKQREKFKRLTAGMMNASSGSGSSKRTFKSPGDSNNRNNQEPSFGALKGMPCRLCGKFGPGRPSIC